GGRVFRLLDVLEFTVESRLSPWLGHPPRALAGSILPQVGSSGKGSAVSFTSSAWVPEDPRDSRRVEAGIEVAQKRRTTVEEEAHGRETSNRHAAGAIRIHVAESRCEPAVPPVSCNEAQRVVARSTAAFAKRYGLNPRR